MDWDTWGPSSLDPRARKREVRDVPASVGEVVEESSSGFTGAILRTERSGGVHLAVLEDGRGTRRSFPLGFGFMVDGEPVRLIPPVAAAPSASRRTASGSVKVEQHRARVARASRIWVEGVHDAELVEKIWGDDLRVEGIVVEPLHGVDDLAGAIRDFSPGPHRRLGVLVDHLVSGSKEERIAREAMAVPGAADNVLVVGHPYVDVWQVIKPRVLGFDAWPEIPRGQDWKTGILQWLGWPHRTKEDVGLGWKRLLSQVSTYADIEPTLLSRVEQVIDFLTEPAQLNDGR
ncbi:MAG: DUF3097 domain-containing protein [Micrococcaceae bacterium]